MKLSESFWQTFKEAPSDAQIISHILMLRAGLIHKSGSGIYNYLPMGYRSIRKVEQVIREEMDQIGQEVCMSIVTPGELWQESGRWEKMGSEGDGTMLTFQDKKQRDLCISPTNEEAVVDIFRSFVKSYKQLPLSLYQINTKFRDEIRPRFGLMRGREFIMKDAYSFHADHQCMDRAYEQYYHAYNKIFSRLGLDTIAVEADAGAMGDAGSKTHEFQVIADSGEDSIVYCPKTRFAANIEMAETKRAGLKFCKEDKLEEVHTPAMGTIEDVCNYLECPQHHSLKSLVYSAIDGDAEYPVLALLLGDDTLNENKLKNVLACDHLVPAGDGQLKEWGLKVGFIGPYKLEVPELKIVLDAHVDVSSPYTCGANKRDYHHKGMVPERDMTEFAVADIRTSRPGDHTPDGKGTVEVKRGIEVGHIFQLGDKYSRAMDTSVLSGSGTPQFPLMGCYGIGVTRIVAAAVEQHHDDKGIIWPKNLTPYHVYFALLSKDPKLHQVADDIYRELWESGVEVVLDDRPTGAGFKFKDADLTGFPLRLVLGEKVYDKSGELEIVERRSGAEHLIQRDEVVPVIQELLAGI